MPKSIPTPIPNTPQSNKTLLEQKTDFTAEGAPPTGYVGTAPPETAPAPDAKQPTLSPAPAKPAVPPHRKNRIAQRLKILLPAPMREQQHVGESTRGLSLLTPGIH